MYRMLSWKYLKGIYDIYFASFLDWNLGKNGRIVGVTTSLWYIFWTKHQVYLNIFEI